MRHDKPEQSGNHPDRGNASRAMVLLAGLLFVLTSFPMLALDPATANTQYGLRTWTSEDGLPENFVAASAQTPILPPIIAPERECPASHLCAVSDELHSRRRDQ